MTEPYSQRHGFAYAVDCIAVLVMLVVAAGQAAQATRGLYVPGDPDLFRDATHSARIRSGELTADPFLLGERAAYNPLVPSVVAALSYAMDVTPLELYARGGVALNLLPVVAFYALALSWFGAGAAATAVFAYLFLLPSNVSGWLGATYSPVLFADGFAQGLFYLDLIALTWARGTQRMWPWGIVGCALGITFLAHTAPALLFGALVVVVALSGSNTPRRKAALNVLVAVATAFIVAMPLIATVLFHYQMGVRNARPAQWTSFVLEAEHLAEVVRSQVAGRVGLGAIGAAWMLRDWGTRRQFLLLAWAVINALAIAFQYIEVPLQSTSVRFPSVVPVHHFIMYFHAVLALLAGYGVWRSVVFAAGRMVRAADFANVAALALLIPFLIGAFVWLKPTYEERDDFVETRAQALKYQSRPSDKEGRDWIRNSTGPGDVFLASDLVGLFVVGPAAGRVVALDPVFANHYVAMGERERDRNDMSDSLANADVDGFCRLARSHEVRFVVSDASRDLEPRVPADFAPLRPAAQFGPLSIWRVTGCP